jgi:Na+-translocating ferredoxin:NAD+ oxidoreductase subunit B
MMQETTSVVRILVASSAVLLILGGLFGIMLGYFKSIFKVEVNPKIELIMDCLPGANCGACGYTGCTNFAENLVSGNAKITSCRAGGIDTATALSKIMEEKNFTEGFEEMSALAICQGGKLEAILSSVTQNNLSCIQAKQLKLDNKLCRYCCLGFGDCEKVCPFNAIKISDNLLPIINPNKCTSCGICVTTCPRNILELVPKKNIVITLCRNENSASFVKRTCSVGCITCFACEKNCPTKAITMINKLPVINHLLCNLCGTCVTVCPTKSMVLIEMDKVNKHV